jgi:hypothetical protein
MHDTPVRMLAKGVIRSIVPWQQARSFFATRLRRRLMEETLADHILSTDASVSRADAVSLVRDWHQQATSHGGWMGSAASPTSAGSSRAAAAHAPGGTSPHPSCSPSPAVDLDQAARIFLAQLQEDTAFLSWAESSGRALIALELRALRTRSASRQVAQVLGSVEGREGLLVSLQAAAKKDAVLAMQLRMMLNEVAGAGSVGGP